MTLDYIKDQSGKHFDPEVVDAFLAIYDVIAAIRDKYQEEGPGLSAWPPRVKPPARPSGAKILIPFPTCSRERYPTSRLRHPQVPA